MGTPTPKTLGDYHRFNADVAVRCGACGRLAVFDAREVMMYFYRKRWSEALPVDPARFRCGCGSPAAQVFAKRIDERPAPLPPRLGPLMPLYTIQEKR